jgi:ribosomal protein S3
MTVMFTTIADRLQSNAAEVKYGSVGISLKIHDGCIVETSYTVSECTKERGQKHEVNQEWGHNRKGFVDAPCGLLS